MLGGYLVFTVHSRPMNLYQRLPSDVHSFTQQVFVEPCYVSVLDVGDRAMNETAKPLSLKSLTFWEGVGCGQLLIAQAGKNTSVRLAHKRKAKAHLVLLCLALWCFTDVAFFTNWRQDPPPAKRLRLTLLQYSHYCGDLEWNPQCLWGMPVIWWKNHSKLGSADAGWSGISDTVMTEQKLKEAGESGTDKSLGEGGVTGQGN